MEFSMENSSFCPLVGGFNPSEKYESQLGWWLFPINMESHKILWFQSPPTINDDGYQWLLGLLSIDETINVTNGDDYQ